MSDDNSELSARQRDEARAALQRDLPFALSPSGSFPSPEGGPDLLATSDIVVEAQQIAAVARYLRASLNYIYLSNITAVDLLAHGCFELVYNFYRLSGGPALTIKTRLPREKPELPSLTPFWPGAAFQEREAYDLFGIVFKGHPDLRRIYMWDEFEGFPMRKDFVRQGDKYLSE